MLTAPTKHPEVGFYYHYKHDPSQGITHHAYEVTAIASHTEDDDAWFVVYRPLYDSAVFKISEEIGIQCVDIRPLDMWMEDVPKGPNGEMIPRFSPITDPVIVSKLEEAREKMYSMSN
jgi:hypothetical protein